MKLTTFNLPPEFQWHTSMQEFAGVPLATVNPTPEQLVQLAQALNQSADQFRTIPITDIVEALDRTVQRWQQPDFAPRQALIATLPSINGYSSAMLEHVIDRMLADWRSEIVWQRLQQAFNHPAYLDGWHESPVGMTWALGPRLMWHVCAGNVPGVALQSLIDAMLVKSPSLVKVASGEPLWTAAFVATLVEELPALRSSIAVLWWQGGSELEHVLFPQLEAVIANASNQAIHDLRRRLPQNVRLIDYGSRISFSVISREMLVEAELSRLINHLAYDVSMFEQRGCVSPQMIFVETNDDAVLTLFMSRLNQAMAEINAKYPHQPDANQCQAVRQLRDEIEWRELAGEPVTWLGDPAGAWTIMHDPEAEFSPSIGGRTVMIHLVNDLAEIPTLIAPLASALQSVAIAAPQARLQQCASQLANVGISRITALGQQSFPHPLWHHDSRDPLQALVRWCDLEVEDRR